MLQRLNRDERGATLIMALLVAFVVLMLSIYVIAQATHNQSRAAYDRKRLTAEYAAEAGLNWYFNSIQNSAVESLQLAAYTGKVISGPNSVSFTATPTYYSDATGTTLFCAAGSSTAACQATLSATNYPKSVKVVSVGTASDGTKRQMETFMALHPIYGGYDGAMITNASTSFTNNFTVNGDTNGNDGDIVVLSGDFNATAGLETVKGNIYVVNGSASITTSLHVYGQVWANNSTTVNNAQALVDLDAKATTGGVSVPSTTGGTVKGSAYYCTGSAPGSNVLGAKIQTCSLGPPPAPASYPHVVFDQSAWESQGYWVHPFFTGSSACTDAQKYVESNNSGSDNYSADAVAHPGGVLVRIQATCTYQNSVSNPTINLGSNLAIITDGGINLANKNTWNGVTSMRSLYFISDWRTGSPDCPTQNISVGNLTAFNNLVQVSFYTPCTVTLNNLGSFYGQVIGSTLAITNNFTLNYRPVLIPGAHVTGFKEDIAYIREVRTS
ncbi:MAG: pilus assembly PilX N-terminal domain-containing protein [Actinobacteria bacterium]|nr:pilus assembly PilX N-terminal domain-containing protein [Actinomycetota bacterium]